jgi:GTP-binding protein
MYDYLKHYGLDGLVVATKSDKISRNETAKSIAQIRKTLRMEPDDLVIPVSALDKKGHENLLAAMEDILNAQK